MERGDRAFAPVASGGREVTDLEYAQRLMRDLVAEPESVDSGLLILAEQFDKAVALLRNVNDLFYEHPLPPNETIAEEVREFFGLPV
jgi:hypothetical protein